MNFEKDLKLFESKGYALGEEATNDTSTSSSKDKGKIKQKDNNKTVKESKESKKVKSGNFSEGYKGEGIDVALV
jgi:hypothetical protein